MRVLCSLQKNEEHVATLNGIPMKMYEQAHFTLEEWAALAPATYKNCGFMFTVPFHECIQTDVVSFLGRGKEYIELTMQNYLLSLAFVQRCRLPLEYTMNFGPCINSPWRLCQISQSFRSCLISIIKNGTL